MRTITFKSVLDGVLTRMGLDPTATEDPAVKATVAEYITDRVKEAWEGYDWPETRACEPRVYRRRWEDVDPSEIEEGDILFHAGEYWTALTDNPASEPEEGAAEWELAEDFERYVALDQEGETPISEVIAIWTANPRISSNTAVEVDFELTENGAQVDDDAPAEVWVEFSRHTPKFTSVAWALTTTYAAGDVVFHAGDCYVARQASTGSTPAGELTADWVRQPMLAILERFAKKAAYSDTLAEDGQQAKADRELRLAYRALEDEHVKLAHRQGQTRGYTVRRG